MRYQKSSKPPDQTAQHRKLVAKIFECVTGLKKCSNAINDQVLCTRSCLTCVLKAKFQLLGEYLDIRLMEYPRMISRNLMGFGAACEEFTPPEIRIASGQHWPVFAPKDDSRAPQLPWLVRTRRIEKNFFQVR